MTSEAADSASLTQMLGRILDAFELQPTAAREALKQWNKSDPGALALLGVLHLGRHMPVRRAERHLARVLGIHGLWPKHLVDPELLTGGEAIAAAGLLAEGDVEFVPRLIATSSESSPEDVVMRIFDIVVALKRAGVVVPWLQRMTRHTNPRVQSRASLIFCRLYANPMLVERQMTSPDDRVRANAIEALWHMDSAPVRSILHKAASDKHHRVALNAILGLYYLHTSDAVDRMAACAASESPLFRAAAAWAMGTTGDPVFTPHLEALASDEAENVRLAASAALKKVNAD